MKPFKIEISVFNVDVYFVVCSLKELKKLAKENYPDADISNLEDSTAGVVGNLIWITDTIPDGSIEFLQNLCHEIVHVSDMVMEDLGLEGSETRAYMCDYLIGQILTEKQNDFSFKE